MAVTCRTGVSLGVNTGVSPRVKTGVSLTAALFGILAFSVPPEHASAQAAGSALPATAPTTRSPQGAVAPLAGIATAADRPGAPHHHAAVSCDGGRLTVHADNSSLNGILRSVSRCTGMKISGGVADQRVFGDYGPAAPATVLATLLDGTGSNMLLLETASDQPAELVLTPRTGGVTPPSPSSVADDDEEDAQPAQPGYQPGNGQHAPGQPTGSYANGAMRQGAGQGNGSGTNQQPYNLNQTPVPQPMTGSAVTSPPSIPQPINNVNGSPNNVSPTASTYPTTNSVPLDTLPTPSTTPSADGIVDAPNPPAPGSDTANLLRGVTTNNPGTTTIVPGATSNATLPGATNTTTPVPNGPTPDAGATSGTTPGMSNGALTPQQVYQQLQQIRQQQQQQQSPTTPSPQ